MTALFYALMVIGLVGVIVCKKKQKTNPNAQSLAFIFFIPVLIGLIGVLYNNLFKDETAAIMDNEKAYASARSAVIAKYLGGKFSGKSAVIITEKELNDISKAGIAKMEEALKAAGVNVIATEALNVPATNPDNPVPMEELYTAKVYNDTVAKFKNADLIVLLAPLPTNPAELPKLSMFKGKQKIVLTSGDVYNMKGTLTQGLVVAAIGMKNTPDAYDPEKAAPSDVQKAFDTRYILITPENVKTVADQNKDMFAK